MSGSIQWLFLTCLGFTFFVNTSLGQYLQPGVLDVNYCSSTVLELMATSAPAAPVVLDQRITATLQDFVAKGLMQSWDADRILNALSKITYSGAISTYDADRMLRHLVSTANGPVTSYDTDRILEALYSIENNGVQHSVFAPNYIERLAAKHNFVRPWYHKFFGALSNLVRAGYESTKYVAEHLEDHAEHLK